MTRTRVDARRVVDARAIIEWTFGVIVHSSRSRLRRARMSSANVASARAMDARARGGREDARGEEGARASTSSANVQARVGREKQRYNAQNQRLVAGCICYRRIAQERFASEDSAERLVASDVARGDAVEVLMVNSKKGPRESGRELIFPKGGWEMDETDAEAAARECLEEGGVAGDVSASKKTYDFVSRSRVKAGVAGDEARCVAHVFTMEVKKEYERWPEQGVRMRHWLTPTEAWRRCKHDWMRRALEECEHLGLGGKEPLVHF